MLFSRSNIAATAVFATIVLAGYVHATHAAPASYNVDVRGARFNPDIVQVKVSLAELDLGSRAGAQIAFRRIQGAASVICGDSPLIADLGGSGQYRRCMTAAISDGVDQLGNPLVTALAGDRVARPVLLANR